jgi:hypothetical protein
MNDWLWRQATYIPALVFVAFYLFDGREELNLFLATWCIIHAKGEEILDEVKKERKVAA